MSMFLHWFVFLSLHCFSFMNKSNKPKRNQESELCVFTGGLLNANRSAQENTLQGKYTDMGVVSILSKCWQESFNLHCVWVALLHHWGNVCKYWSVLTRGKCSACGGVEGLKWLPQVQEIPTNAGPTISVHAEAFAALTVISARCIDTRLLASSIELLTLIYIWTHTCTKISLLINTLRQMLIKKPNIHNIAQHHKTAQLRTTLADVRGIGIVRNVSLLLTVSKTSFTSVLVMNMVQLEARIISLSARAILCVKKLELCRTTTDWELWSVVGK